MLIVGHFKINVGWCSCYCRPWWRLVSFGGLRLCLSVVVHFNILFMGNCNCKFLEKTFLFFLAKKRFYFFFAQQLPINCGNILFCWSFVVAACCPVVACCWSCKKSTFALAMACQAKVCRAITRHRPNHEQQCWHAFIKSCYWCLAISLAIFVLSVALIVVVAVFLFGSCFDCIRPLCCCNGN